MQCERRYWAKCLSRLYGIHCSHTISLLLCVHEYCTKSNNHKSALGKTNSVDQSSWPVENLELSILTVQHAEMLKEYTFKFRLSLIKSHYPQLSLVTICNLSKNCSRLDLSSPSETAYQYPSHVPSTFNPTETLHNCQRLCIVFKYYKYSHSGGTK